MDYIYLLRLLQVKKSFFFEKGLNVPTTMQMSERPETYLLHPTKRVMCMANGNLCSTMSFKMQKITRLLASNTTKLKSLTTLC
jgi:hypothetical protein